MKTYMNNDWFHDYFINELKAVRHSRSGSVSKMETVTLLSDNWDGDGPLYIQTVDISSVTSNSQIELRSSPEQLHELLESGIALTAVNDSGVVKISAIGGKPTTDYSMQIIVSDVEGS